MSPFPSPGAVAGLLSLRAGDLLFTRITRPRSASILVKLGQLVLGERVRLGPISIDHVLVVVEPAHPVKVTDPLPEDFMTDDQGKMWTLPRGVQAMPRGAEEIALTPETHWRPWCAYARLAPDYPGQHEDAAAVARQFVQQQVRYSFASYVLLALWRFGLRAERLARHIDRRRPPEAFRSALSQSSTLALPVEAICSVLADQAWTLAGKDVVTGTRSQIVTPGRLALQLWRRSAGVVWSGPTID